MAFWLQLLRESGLFFSRTKIRPVLLQNKQVDQANANNARLLPADRRGPPSPASSA
jgi:hypothetical protein